MELAKRHLSKRNVDFSNFDLIKTLDGLYSPDTFVDQIAVGASLLTFRTAGFIIARKSMCVAFFGEPIISISCNVSVMLREGSFIDILGVFISGFSQFCVFLREVSSLASETSANVQRNTIFY